MTTVLPGDWRPGCDNAGHDPSPEATAALQGNLAAGVEAELMDELYWSQFGDVLTAKDVAGVLRVSQTTVLRMLHEGVVPAHYIGRSWIVFKVTFRAWLATRRNVPLAEAPNAADPLAAFDDELRMPELRRLFGKTKQTIRRWLEEEQIPGYLVNGRWVAYRSELRERLAATSNERGSSHWRSS